MVALKTLAPPPCKVSSDGAPREENWSPGPASSKTTKTPTKDTQKTTHVTQTSNSPSFTEFLAEAVEDGDHDPVQHGLDQHHSPELRIGHSLVRRRRAVPLDQNLIYRPN